MLQVGKEEMCKLFFSLHGSAVMYKKEPAKDVKMSWDILFHF